MAFQFYPYHLNISASNIAKNKILKMAFSRKEFRIVLPLTTEEYQIGQLFAVAEASKKETGGGEGIEVVENTPYEKEAECGQYTKKIFRLQSRVPKYLKLVMPKGSLTLLEEAWNAYPYCKTVISNPDYMGENFKLIIETLHLQDLGDSENVHELPKKDWDETEVIRIDIANDSVCKSDYCQELDPSLFKSKKTGRGPLGANWIADLKSGQPHTSNAASSPYMCAYKLVSCRFKWFGIQNRVENLIFKTERRIFSNFNRQVVCTMDSWHGLTLEQIRKIEDETKQDLDSLRGKGTVRGTVNIDNDETNGQ